MQSGRYTKIGVSNDVDQRLSDLKIGNPHSLEVIFSKEPRNVRATELEKELHDALRDKRHRGEWFVLDEESFSTIIDVFAKYSMTIPTVLKESIESSGPIPEKENSWWEDFLGRLSSRYEGDLPNTVQTLISKYNLVVKQYKSIRKHKNALEARVSILERRLDQAKEKKYDKNNRL